MKQILIVIFNIILFLPTYCQVSWFPVGAKWHYLLVSMIGDGLTTLEVLSEDTLIGNHTYKKIISQTIIGADPESLDTFTEFLYVFEENKVVVGYNKYLGTTLLYDFNATVGDTLGISFGGLSPYPFVVDSIGMIDMNGSQLAFQDIRFPNFFEPGEFYKMRAIEGIGSINMHLFHDHNILEPIDFPFYSFRCYEDENIGLINLSYNQVDCDYIEGVTSTLESTKLSLTVFPNPADDFVTVQNIGLPIENFIIFDVQGLIRIKQHSTHQDFQRIEINELESGLYFIIGVDKTGKKLFTEKLAKYGS